VLITPIVLISCANAQTVVITGLQLAPARGPGDRKVQIRYVFNMAMDGGLVRKVESGYDSPSVAGNTASVIEAMHNMARQLAKVPGYEGMIDVASDLQRRLPLMPFQPTDVIEQAANAERAKRITTKNDTKAASSSSSSRGRLRRGGRGGGGRKASSSSERQAVPAFRSEVATTAAVASLPPQGFVPVPPPPSRSSSVTELPASSKRKADMRLVDVIDLDAEDDDQEKKMPEPDQVIHSPLYDDDNEGDDTTVVSSTKTSTPSPKRQKTTEDDDKTEPPAMSSPSLHVSLVPLCISSPHQLAASRTPPPSPVSIGVSVASSSSEVSVPVLDHRPPLSPAALMMDEHQEEDVTPSPLPPAVPVPRKKRLDEMDDDD
jgi:hypothetical protein